MKMRFIFPVLLLLLILSACAAKEPPAPSTGETVVEGTEEPPAPGVQIPNPLKIVDTFEELTELCGFTPPIPSVLPEGYIANSYICITEEIAQITYAKDALSILYRVKEGDGSISGDYNEYDYQGNISAAGTKINAKGSGEDSLSLAEWAKDDFTFSLAFDEAVDKATLTRIIESIS